MDEPSENISGGESSGSVPTGTHLHRITRRVGLAPLDPDHEALRAALKRDVLADTCGFGRAVPAVSGRQAANEEPRGENRVT